MVYKSETALKAGHYGYSQWELVFVNDLRLDASVYFEIIFLGHITHYK